MAKLNPVKQIGFLQKGDDVSSRNICKELLDGANIEVSGSDALVEPAERYLYNKIPIFDNLCRFFVEGYMGRSREKKMRCRSFATGVKGVGRQGNLRRDDLQVEDDNIMC